jgi:hypothetical protein
VPIPNILWVAAMKLGRRKRGLCIVCGREGSLPFMCSCGLKVCSKRCTHAHELTHRKIHGLPWIPPSRRLPSY